MVTANVEDLGQEFDQIIAERDLASVGVLGLAGAGGGVITTQIVNRVAPIVGLSPSPSAPRELFGVGVLKLVIGAAMGFVGAQIGGTPGTLLALGGVGTVVLGGGDVLNTALSAGGSTANAIQAQTRQRATGNASSARVVSADASSNTSASATPSSNGTSDAAF
jgi:hypothetical protein